MNENIDFFWDQVKLYEEIEKRRKRRFYALLSAFFFCIIGLVYYLL